MSSKETGKLCKTFNWNVQNIISSKPSVRGTFGTIYNTGWMRQSQMKLTPVKLPSCGTSAIHADSVTALLLFGFFWIRFIRGMGHQRLSVRVNGKPRQSESHLSKCLNILEWHSWTKPQTQLKINRLHKSPLSTDSTSQSQKNGATGPAKGCWK